MNTIDIDKIMQCHLNEQLYTCDVELRLMDAFNFGNFGVFPPTLLADLATGHPGAPVQDFRVVDFKGDADSTLIVQVTCDVTDTPTYWDDVVAPEGWKA